MQESSRGADHRSDLCLHMSLYAGNCSEHVRTLLFGSSKPMQESSRGADHGSDLCLHVSLYAGNCSEHVRTLLIGYRSGGTPDILRNLPACDGIAGRRRESSACQHSGDLPALHVACRCSPVGFDRQQPPPSPAPARPLEADGIQRNRRREVESPFFRRWYCM